MSEPKRKIIPYLFLAGLVAVVGLFLWYRLTPESQSLQNALGRAFNRPAYLIELNLPPADGRYPGAIILSPSPGQTLPWKRVQRPESAPQNATTLKVLVKDEATLGLSNGLIGKANSGGDLEVELELNDLRLFEADLNADFRDEILRDNDLYQSEKRKLAPKAIVRAYEAQVAMKIRKTASISAEAWKEVSEDAINAGGQTAGAGEIVLTRSVPEVVAYETLSIEFIATSLSGGSKPDEVKLTEVEAMALPNQALEMSAFGLTGATEVSFSVAGNSEYVSEWFGNLRMVEPSIDLVSNAFTQSGAKSLLDADPITNLDEEELDALLSRVTEKLEGNAAPFHIFYYVGHAITGLGGQMYLVMNDYEGIPEEDLGEDLFLGLPRAQLDAPGAPLEGSNIDALMDVVNAVQGEYPKEIPGLYPVSRIASRLKETGRKFAILIDACYEHEELDQLREAYHLTEYGDYFGPATDGGPQELFKYSEALSQFGVAPYLHSENPIIFSAAPGTIATQVRDPRPSWVPDRYVAPLARRIYQRLETVAIRSETLNWGAFLQSIVDVKPLGEKATYGTVSWSDFSELRQTPMFQRSDVRGN